MFSYRQVICNRGTLNGRILRFGGRTGVLRSIYQLLCKSLLCKSLLCKSLLCKSLLCKSMTAINFFRWTPRQASAIIETSSHLLCSK